MVLVSAHDETTDIEKLAQLADKVVEVATPTATISAVSASQSRRRARAATAQRSVVLRV